MDVEPKQPISTKIGYAIGVIVVILIPFITIYILWLIFTLISSMDLSKTNPNIGAALIAGIVSILAILLNQYFTKRKEVDFLMWEKKEKIYSGFLESYFKYLSAEKVADKEKFLKEINYEFTKNVLLTGSKKVVNSYYSFKEFAKNNPEQEGLILGYLEEVIHAMRKDLGNGRKLEAGRMLSLMFDDTHADIKKLIGKN